MAAPSTAAELFARHHRDIYRYLARMTGNRDAADDLAQDVFLRVVRALQNGGPVGHERGWIFSIAHHLLIDTYRQRARVLPVADLAVEPGADATQTMAFGLAESLQRLTDEDREIFLLKEVGGLSYQEIAEVSSCTVEAVRSRLYRTRAQLRGMLSIRF